VQESKSQEGNQLRQQRVALQQLEEWPKEATSTIAGGH